MQSGFNRKEEADVARWGSQKQRYDGFALGFGILESSRMIRGSQGQLNLNRGEVSPTVLAMT